MEPKKEETKTEPQKPISQPPTTEKPNRGINERMSDIEAKLDLLVPKEKGKEKFWKMPFMWKSKQKKVEKSLDKVQVIWVGTNGNIKPLVKTIDNGFIENNGKYYDASAGFVLRWMGKTPTLIMLEWRITPLGPQDYEKAVASGLGALDAQKIIIRAMEQAKLDEKGKMSSGMMWILGIGALVVAYLLFGGA